MGEWAEINRSLKYKHYWKHSAEMLITKTETVNCSGSRPFGRIGPMPVTLTLCLSMFSLLLACVLRHSEKRICMLTKLIRYTIGKLKYSRWSKDSCYITCRVFLFHISSTCSFCSNLMGFIRFPLNRFGRMETTNLNVMNVRKLFSLPA